MNNWKPNPLANPAAAAIAGQMHEQALQRRALELSDDPTLSADQLGALLNISGKKAVGLCKSGQIKAVHLERKWRIKFSDAIKYRDE